jgi:hypothetical protein
MAFMSPEIDSEYYGSRASEVTAAEAVHRMAAMRTLPKTFRHLSRASSGSIVPVIAGMWRTNHTAPVAIRIHTAVFQKIRAVPRRGRLSLRVAGANQDP